MTNVKLSNVKSPIVQTIARTIATIMLVALLMPAVGTADEPVPLTPFLLIEERERQQQRLQMLREHLRTQTKQAAEQDAALRPAQGETLLRDLAIAESQLVAMQAKRKAIQARVGNPPNIPPEILMQFNSEQRNLQTQKEMLQQQREGLSQTLRRQDDPRIMQIERQIENVERKIKELDSTDNSSREQALQEVFRDHEIINLFQLNQDIQKQEFLVAELRKRHQEQLAQKEQAVVDPMFGYEEQLRRVIRIIDAINDRIDHIRSLQSEPKEAMNPAPDDSTNRELLLRILEVLERIETRLAHLPIAQQQQENSRSTTEIQKPKLEMELIGTDTIQWNDTATYTLRIRNVGNSNAENIRLELLQTSSPETSRCEILEPLRPGETQELIIQIQRADKEQDHIEIAVLATGSHDLKAEVKRLIQVVR